MTALAAVVDVVWPKEERIKSCSEFDSQPEAQAYYATKDLSSSDCPDVDPDSDGISCEELL